MLCNSQYELQNDPLSLQINSSFYSIEINHYVLRTIFGSNSTLREVDISKRLCFVNCTTSADVCVYLNVYTL